MQSAEYSSTKEAYPPLLKGCVNHRCAHISDLGARTAGPLLLFLYWTSIKTIRYAAYPLARLSSHACRRPAPSKNWSHKLPTSASFSPCWLPATTFLKRLIGNLLYPTSHACAATWTRASYQTAHCGLNTQVCTPWTPSMSYTLPFVYQK